MSREERDFGEEHDPREDERPEPPEPPEYDREEEWERQEARREQQEAEDRYFAQHPKPKGPPALRPEPEYIAGIPFGPDPKNPTLSDLAQCLLCKEVVDVGGEMRDHIARHEEQERELYS